VREGILGGSFDPVHNGHLHVAGESLRRLSLDRVVFVPARLPPHKLDVPLSDAMHRLKMLELAVAGTSTFEVSEVELRRAGASYTVDTVETELARLGEAGEVFLLIGADQAADLGDWHRVGELVRLCTVVVVSRPGFAPARLERLRTRLSAEAVEKLASAALDIPPVDVSSTEIRRRVRAGRSITGLVPAAVESYIRTHRLYRD
jgi:nicotinate-nucleotide adenylyltransferase